MYAVLICDHCCLKKSSEGEITWMRASLFSHREAFSSLSLQQQRPLRCQLSCRPCSCSSLAWARQQGPLFLLTTAFPLLPQGSKLKCGKSCLLIKFAVGKPCVCTVGTHKQQRISGLASHQTAVGSSASALGLFLFPEGWGLWGRFQCSFWIETNPWFSLKQLLYPWISCCNH